MKQITRSCRILWNLQRQRNMLMFTPDTIIPTLTLSTIHTPLEVFFSLIVKNSYPNFLLKLSNFSHCNMNTSSLGISSFFGRSEMNCRWDIFKYEVSKLI